MTSALLSDAAASTEDSDKLDVNYHEELPILKSVILQVESSEDANKADSEIKEPIQDESKNYAALPKSSGNRPEPTPISRKKYFIYLQLYSDIVILLKF